MQINTPVHAITGHLHVLARGTYDNLELGIVSYKRILKHTCTHKHTLQLHTFTSGVFSKALAPHVNVLLDGPVQLLLKLVNVALVTN